MRRAAGVAVTDDAEPGPDLEPFATVAGLLGDLPTRPPVVPVPGGCEEADDLDDVEVGPAQGSARSTKPYSPASSAVSSFPARMSAASSSAVRRHDSAIRSCSRRS